MKRRSLALLNSGPSGGKSTLVYQHIQRHFAGEPPFVPGFEFPEGRVCIVQTDRSLELNRPTIEAAGLWGHPGLEIINIVDDRELHNITVMNTRNEAYTTQLLRNAITKRLKGKGCGALILDLYNDFQTSDLKNVKRTAGDSRANLQWAADLDLVILGIVYSFKQTTANSAKRTQDRAAGSLAIQASANFKFTIVDAEELAKPYYEVHVVPGPGEGTPHKGADAIKLIRGTEAEGDPVGLFRPYTDDIANDELEADTLDWVGSLRSIFATGNKTKQELVAAGFSDRMIRTALDHKIINRPEWGLYGLVEGISVPYGTKGRP